MKSAGRIKGKKWFVFGAGGQARVVIATARACGLPDPQACLVDDGSEKKTKPVMGIPVLAMESVLSKRSLFFPAIGDNRDRDRLMRHMFDLGWKPISIRHPSVVSEKSVSTGWATICAMGVIIQTGARIGNGVIVNTGVIIEHDVVVGDCAHIAPGSVVLGEAVIGRCVLVGAGSIILPSVKIGDGAVIGARSVVRDDVAPKTTVVGAPARVV